jgi:DNA-binding MarR family transcriptional regulator
MTLIKGLDQGRPSAAGTLDLAETVGRMATTLSGLSAQWLRGLTINAHERLALFHLWENGPMTMSELGARIPLSRAAITALTDRLEALGYVTRTPDEHDRRRTMLSLTDVPAELIETFVADWRRDVAQVAGALDPREQATIIRFMESLRTLQHERAAALRKRPDAELPHPPSPAG